MPDPKPEDEKDEIDPNDPLWKQATAAQGLDPDGEVAVDVDDDEDYSDDSWKR